MLRVRALLKLKDDVVDGKARALLRNHPGDHASEAMPGAAEVYQAIITNADRVFIVADSSKFHKRALTLLSDWQANFTLVTDAEPEGELRAALQDRGTCIEVAEFAERKPFRGLARRGAGDG